MMSKTLQNVKPLLNEMLKNSNIEQNVTMEFLNNAPEMQIAATDKMPWIQNHSQHDTNAATTKNNANDQDQPQLI